MIYFIAFFMKLSIIIITKNEEKYLPKLLDSIKAQKVNFDYEIIVSDAFSEDKTLEIAKKYGCKITEGGLPSKWRNNGANIANWEWLLFLDADTIVPEWALQIWIDKLEMKKADVWIPYAKLRKDEKNLLADLFFRTTFFSYNFTWWAFGCGIFVKKKFFKKVNGFDESIYLAEDIDFVKRIVKSWWKRVNLLPMIEYSWRRFEKSWIFTTILRATWWHILLMFGIKQKKNPKNEKLYKL